MKLTWVQWILPEKRDGLCVFNGSGSHWVLPDLRPKFSSFTNPSNLTSTVHRAGIWAGKYLYIGRQFRRVRSLTLTLAKKIFNVRLSVFLTLFELDSIDLLTCRKLNSIKKKFNCRIFSQSHTKTSTSSHLEFWIVVYLHKILRSLRLISPSNDRKYRFLFSHSAEKH